MGKIIRLTASTAWGGGLFCALLLLTGQSVRAGAVLEFRPVCDYLVVVPVSLNGAGPFDFLLDTGSNSTTLAPDLARQLGLRPLDRVTLITVAGSQPVPRSFVPSVALAGKTVQNLEVLWGDVRAVQSVAPTVRGILGQNFLAHFNYLIDYRGRRIIFEEGEELRTRLTGPRLPIELDEGRIVVSARSDTAAGPGLRFVLDSALATAVLFEPTLRTHKLKLDCSAGDWLKAATTVSSRAVRPARLRDLPIGGEVFTDLAVVLVREPAVVAGRAENGLLPTSLFAAVYFNNRDRFVIVGPRRDR